MKISSVITSSPVKASVRVATTSAGTLATSFEAGDSVDGVTLAAGDRILIKDQSTAAENGIYIVGTSGEPTRAPDFDKPWKIEPGAVVHVESGTVNAWGSFLLVATTPVTVDSTSLAFPRVNALHLSGTWTPTLTAATINPTLGTGSAVDGHFQRIGRRVWFDCSLRFGTSGASAGSGLYLVDLPVPPVTGRDMIVGTGTISDASDSNRTRLVAPAVIPGFSTTKLVMILDDATIGNGDSPVSSGKPWARASGSPTSDAMGLPRVEVTRVVRRRLPSVGS